MTNMYGVEIQKGCCSCKYNHGTHEYPRVDSSAKSCICEQYDCEVRRAGKENCQYYGMKDWLWNLNPANSNGLVKPKAFLEWIGTVDMSNETTGLTHKNKMNKIEFKDGALWDSWIKNTNEGRLYIAEHPDR